MPNDVIVNTNNNIPRLLDKNALRLIPEAQDTKTGFVLDSTATPQKTRELMSALGILAEDTSFSREIRRMREGE